MMYLKKTFFILLIGISVAMMSCSTSMNLNTSNVTYKSIRTTFAQPDESHPIPEEAEIVLGYSLTNNGDLTVIVFNRTDEIMTIDQTKSFFVDSNGKSVSYYDPTIRTTSTTNTVTNTQGTTVNLGAVAGAFGIGGVAGTLLRGINVGEADTQGTSTTHITQVADMPEVSLSPRSQAAMSKVYNVSSLRPNSGYSKSMLDMSYDNSYCKFSVCISYSIDGCKSFKKLVTCFYVNSLVIVPVSSNEMINDALKQVYTIKPDAIYETLYMLNFNDNRNSHYIKGMLFDFQ